MHPKMVIFFGKTDGLTHRGMGQNPGKWMFIPLKMVLIGIDPHP
jgi:hypothetical protein